MEKIKEEGNMSIEEIEKQINNLPDIVEHKTCFTVYYNNIWHRMNPSDTIKVENFLKLVNILKNFMHANLNQHKDTIDKVTDLEKQVVELRKKIADLERDK